MVDDDRTSPDEHPLGKSESVEVLLDFAREVALDDEQERQRHLDTKAGTLAGFVAVALSLEAGLGASVLLDGALGCGAETLFTAFFIVAVVGLAASALFALLGILAPKGYLALDEDAIHGLASNEEMNAPAEVIRERQLETLVQITLEGRKTNDEKAQNLKRASIALACGIAAIAAQGLVLAFA